MKKTLLLFIIFPIFLFIAQGCHKFYSNEREPVVHSHRRVIWMHNSPRRTYRRPRAYKHRYIIRKNTSPRIINKKQPNISRDKKNKINTRNKRSRK